MKAAIYTRIAADEVGQADLDLAGQRIAAEGAVNAHGWQVAVCYQDTGYGGHSLTRPALSRLLADAREGLFEKLVVARADRLMAGTETMLSLVERLAAAGVTVYFVREGLDTATEEGRHLLGVGRAVLGQISRRERKEGNALHARNVTE